MLIYGKNVAKNILEKNHLVNKIYLLENFRDEKILTLLEKKNLRPNILQKKEFSRFGIENHQGIIMDVELNNKISLKEILDSSYELIVMLDHLEDPHNMGAIIRTCVAAGVDALIIPNKRSVSLSGTVMKTSAGTMLDLPISEVSNLHDALIKLKKAGFWVIGADMTGADYKELDYQGKIVLVIGNEGKGLSKLISKECDFLATLPLKNVESLNASVAAGIIIYEAISNRK